MMVQENTWCPFVLGKSYFNTGYFGVAWPFFFQHVYLMHKQLPMVKQEPR